MKEATSIVEKNLSKRRLAKSLLMGAAGLFLVFFVTRSALPSENLFPVKVNGKVGYGDRKTGTKFTITKHHGNAPSGATV